jgi:hypothetical protein
MGVQAAALRHGGRRRARDAGLRLSASVLTGIVPNRPGAKRGSGQHPSGLRGVVHKAAAAAVTPLPSLCAASPDEIGSLVARIV